MAVPGAVGVRADPVMGYNFLISLLDTSSSLALGAITSAINDIAVGGFTECSGLEMSLDVEEYREGGRNSEALQFPTRVKWSKITLRKGVGATTALWDWHYGFVQGTGRRRDGLIVLMTDLHVPHNIWHFRRGLPTRYSGPALNAGQSGVAIESIEIAHEGIYQLPGISSGATAASATARPAI